MANKIAGYLLLLGAFLFPLMAISQSKSDYSPMTLTAESIGKPTTALMGLKCPGSLTTCNAPITFPALTVGTQTCLNNQCNTGAASGPDFPGNNCYDFTGATAWFQFTVPPGAATMTVNITGASFANPYFMVFGTTNCNTYTLYNDGNECYQGAGGAATGNMAVPAGATLLIAVSGQSGQSGNFNICLTPLADNSACNVNSALTVTNTSMGSPLAGPYQPGEVVSFCYNINQYNQANCNWLQGIVPTFGDCWAPSSFTATGQPVNITTPLAVAGTMYAGTGAWAWWPAGSVQYNNPVYNVGAGWFFSQTAGMDPDSSWGDGNGMGAMGNCDATGGGLTWSVCFNLTVRSDCQNGTNCAVTMKTYADGEIGSWSNLGCAADLPDVYNAAAICCQMIVNAGTNQTICSTGSANLNGTVSNNEGPTTYSWTASPLAAQAGISNPNILNPTFTPPPGVTGPVVLTLTVTDDNCTLSSQVTVTVTPLPTATISYAGTPFCTTVATAQPVTLNGTGAYTGGTYSSAPAGLTINASTGAVTPSTSTPGTYTVTYTTPASGGCPAVQATASVTITAAPTAVIDYADPFCSTDGPQTVSLSGTGAYTGGTFTAGAGLTINSSTGTVTPSSSTPGSYTVTYTIPASGGCVAVPVTTPVIITPLPTATISYAGSPFCTTVATAQPVTLNGTGAYTGGTYSSAPAGLTINASTGAVTPSTSTPGTYTVTYTTPASGGCPAVQATASVTITAAPTAVIDYADPFCSTDGPQTVSLSGTGAYTGGTFTAGAGLTINSSTGTVTPSSSTPGSYTVTYTIPASGGCVAVPVTTPVIITPLPTATISYAGSPFCTTVATAQPVTLNGTGAYTGGTFSAAPAGLTINASTGAVTPSTSIPGTYTVTYTTPASGGCPAVQATASVTITAAPTAIIDYADPFCSTDGPQTVSLSGTGAYTGGTFSSTIGLSLNGVSGTVTPSSSTPGSYTVTYTIPASGGCSAVPVTTGVVITLQPTATIDYADPFCTSVTTAQGVTLNGTGAYTGGVFSATPAGLTLNAANGAITPSTSTPGTYTVTYTIPLVGGCPATDVATSVTINPIPVFTLAGTSPTVCNGTNGFIVISGLENGTSYNVSYNDDGVPQGPFNLMSNGSGEITISGLSAGSYDNFLIALVSTGCAGTSATSVSLANPGAPDVFDIADQVICDGTYTLPAITGTDLNNPSYWSGPNGTGTQYFAGNVISSTMLMYIYDANGACTDQENFQITINTSPTATISYATSPWCVDNSTPQVVSLSGTNAYTGGSFSAPVGVSINTFNGSITPNLSTPGTYTITYSTVAAGGCPSVDATTSITVTPLPTATIDYADPFCVSETLPQAVVLNGTNNYLGGTFSAGAGLAIDPTTGEVNPNASTPNTYTVTYTTPAFGGCSSVDATTSVVINAGPTSTIDYADPFCTNFGGAASVNQSGTGSYLGGSFSSTAGLTLNTVTGAITPSSSTPGSYTVTYTIPASGGCPASDVSTTVEVTQLPTASIDYADPFCTSDATLQTVNASGTGNWTTGSYSSSAGLSIDATTGEIDASTSTGGVYTVTYTIAASAGCPDVVANTNVTVTLNPTSTIDYADPFCTNFGGAASVNQSGTGSYLGGDFSSTAGLTLNTVTGAITPSSSTPGSYIVTYTIPASGGCPASDVTTTVEITLLPTASIDYMDPFCTSDATLQTVNASGTGNWTTGSYSSAVGLSIDPTTGDIDASSSIGGTYTVTYTIPLANGCPQVTANTSVTITEAPTATISYNDPFCESDPGFEAVNLSGTGAYLGGDFSSTPAGLTLNVASGSIEPSTSQPNVYTVTYTIPGSAGCPSEDVTTSVTIFEVPVFTLNGTDPSVCNGSDGFIVISGLNANTTYDLTYTDDLVSSGVVSITTDGSGNYNLSGLDAGDYANFVITSNGCSGTNPDVVELLNPGAPNIAPLSPAVACDQYTLPAITGTNLTGNEAFYTGTGGTGTSYNAGDVISSTVTLYLYDIDGTCFDQETFQITINNTPLLDNPGPQVACDSYTLPMITGTYLTGNEAYYSQTAGGGTTWDAGDELTSNQTVYIYDYIGNCDNEVSFTVTITPLPTVTAISGGATYCEGDAVAPIEVEVTGTADWTISYTLNGVAQTATGSSSPISLGNAAGIYTVTEVTDAGCSNIASGTQTITVNVIPDAPNAGSDSTYCSAWTLAPMTASGTGGTMTWYSSTGAVLGTGNNFTPASTEGTTTYYVTETLMGCEGPASDVIITINVCDITTPTAFTPDGDGVNETWQIVDLDNVYPKNIVRIYNRWGNLIYEHDSSVDGPYSSSQWDGTYKGEALPVGSYYFAIELNNDDKDSLTGTVTILKK